MMQEQAKGSENGVTWLTPKEAAEHLKVDVSTVYRMSQRGMLPFYKFGGNRRYKLREVNAVPERVSTEQ